MPDCYPTIITFGPIPAELVDEIGTNTYRLRGFGELPQALFDYAGNGIEPIPSGGFLGVYSDSDAAWGLHGEDCSSLLAWCEEHDVPYLAHQDPKYEFDGESREFWRGDHWSQTANADGDTYLTAAEYVKLRDGDEAKAGAPVLLVLIERALFGFGEHHPTRKAEAELEAARTAARVAS